MSTLRERRGGRREREEDEREEGREERGRREKRLVHEEISAKLGNK